MTRPRGHLPGTFRSELGVEEAEFRRRANEKIAIVHGLSSLLVDADGSVDAATARSALAAIDRSTAELRALLKGRFA